MGQTLNLDKFGQNSEIERHIRLGWGAFGKLSEVFKGTNIPINLKRRTFEQYVLPVMDYGAESWTHTKKMMHKLQVTQRAMERAMLGISLRDRIRNTEIRRRTKLTDITKSLLPENGKGQAIYAVGRVTEMWAGNRCIGLTILEWLGRTGCEGHKTERNGVHWKRPQHWVDNG
ncbi:uncharacterized protein [Choristoneura fumiferana]|uniref:uncharacterized protein n=1 Tax=Choristoneura fumiferana TaxID=7141 RepID=UPI003D15D84B